MEKKTLEIPLDYVQPDINQWGINRLVIDRDEFLHDVVDRVITKIRIEYRTTKSLYEELASTLYQERIRVSTSKWKSDPEDEKDFWSNIKGQLIKFQKNQSWEDSDRKELELILKKILLRYAYEIVGNFTPSVFRTVQKFLPSILYLFLNSKLFTPFKLFSKQSRSFYKKFIITGEFDLIRQLSKIGTLVVVPTHFSNTDSPIIGWAINSLGLEAMTYGAGVNLFGTQPLSYLMGNLGAYKIDRRKKNNIYLELLKTYSQVAIERDTPSLFFPGGTRSRSGALESKLKLGLLSTAIEAQQENFIHQRKKIFVVPVVINYQYNVEASSLINQHLKEEGKEKYVADNFEYSTTYKIVRFFKQLFNTDTEMVISFGQPLDVIGNPVNIGGESLTHQGQKFDIKGYFEFENKIVQDEQRNFEYTKRLGDKIIQSYHQYNTVMTAPLVAFVYFELLDRRHRHLSLYELMLLPLDDRIIIYPKLKSALQNIIDELKTKYEHKEIILSQFILDNDIDKIIQNGIQSINTFSSKKVLYFDSDHNINSEDVRLAYFYHNRLNGYQLEKSV